MELEKTSERKCTCRACLLGRMKHHPHNGEMRKNAEVGEVWHVDVSNFTNPSLGGSYYALHMVDELSGYQRVRFLRKVSAEELLDALLDAMWEQYDEIKKLPYRIRTDQGKGFLSGTVQTGLWNECRTKTSHSNAYKHQENGIAERAIGKAKETMRTLLSESGAPERIWAEATLYHVYTDNRLYNRRIEMTLFEKLTGNRPNLKNLRPFGSETYQKIEPRFTTKTGAQSRSMRMVGYGRSSKTYRIADPEYKSVTEDSGLRFVVDQVSSSGEENEPNKELEGRKNEDSDGPQSEGESDCDEESQQAAVEEQLQSAEQEKEVSDSKKTDLTNGEREKADVELPPANAGESNITARRQVEFRIHHSEVVIPKSFDDIESNQLADMWFDATDSEVVGWLERDPWELVEKGSEMNMLRGHWRFSVKTDSEGFVTRFKARWVVDGSQRPTSTYAGTPAAGSLKALIAFAVTKGWPIHVVDVKWAYSNTRLAELAYMYQIKGYEDKTRPFDVCKLVQAGGRQKDHKGHRYGHINRFSCYIPLLLFWVLIIVIEMGGDGGSVWRWQYVRSALCLCSSSSFTFHLECLRGSLILNSVRSE